MFHFQNECFLLARFDSFVTVIRSDPGDRIISGKAAQDGQAGQSRSSPSVATEATDLNSFASSSSSQNVSQRRDDLSGTSWNIEVRPLDVGVRPRRLPPLVQVQPEVGQFVAGVRICRIERHGDDRGAVRQHHNRTVTMHFERSVVVRAIRALRRLAVCLPIDTAFSAGHDDARLRHHLEP